MKLAYSWLKARINLTIDVPSLAELLTSMGQEVEHIDGYAPVIDHVVVAKIVSVEPHPSADRLRVAQVFDGEQTWSIVCGALNCREGLCVPLAKIGAALPGGFEIKKAKLRGVESFGMLCSLDELGYAGEYEGLYEFDEPVTLGSAAMAAINDPVLVLGLTPDLGHCLSLEGIARLVAAKLQLPFEPLSYPDLNPQESLALPSIALQSPACWQYALMRLDNLRVEPSPIWLQRSLEKAGYRSVNNLVDIGNWIMLKMGRPVHFFDCDRVEGPLTIRSSIQGEVITRLDGVEQILSEGLLVIADQKSPVAIAGVMGSRSHEVHQGTTRALLEVALFDPRSVRAAAKACVCHSESSRRFERGVDLGLTEQVFKAIVDLLQQTGQTPVVSRIASEGTGHFARKEIRFSPKRVQQLLGIEASHEACVDAFTRLGIDVKSHAKDSEVLHCRIPLSRHDLAIEEDLVDEMMKLIGTDKIPRFQCRASLPGTSHDPLYSFSQGLRRRLVGKGLQEIISMDFVGSKKLIDWGHLFPAPLAIANPSSVEMDLLRPNLLSVMLDTVFHNEAQQIYNLALFEVGRVYSQSESGSCETQALGIAMRGSRESAFWDGREGAWDFYDMKGLLQDLFESFAIDACAVDPSAPSSLRPSLQPHPWLHPRQQAAWIDSKGMLLGYSGVVHPKLLPASDSDRPVIYSELSVKDLLEAQKALVGYCSFSPYPSSARDWTVTLPESISFGQVIEAMAPVEGEVELVSVWRSEKLGNDRKNVTLRLHYRSDEKTLTQQEVQAQHEQIQQRVMNRLALAGQPESQ